MNTTLQQRVIQTIGRHSMIRTGDRIGVGVSGGADSTALLHLLSELRAELGIGIFVLHFHHQLRGKEADEDERFVKTLAAELRFECVSDRGDVAGEALRNGWNIEDAARRMRYQYFSSSAGSLKLDRVAVAHTADDQAETVLAHLLRGTGLAGLAGIYPVAGPIIRPLLEIGREDLREYLSSLGRSWQEDATNLDTSRTRARIRHQLLPLLRQDFEASSVTRLARLANLAREDESFWESLEEDRFSALVFRDSSGNLSVKIADLLSPLPWLGHPNGVPDQELDFSQMPTAALTRRLVRRIVANLRGTRHQLTAHHVQDVLDLGTKSSSGSQVTLPGMVVERAFDRLVFSRVSAAEKVERNKETALHSRGFEYAVSLPDPSKMACIVVPEIQRRFSLKVIDWPPASGETGIYRGALDFDRLRWPLVLRNWHSGDSYRPQGHQRVRKLKRMFLKSRVPRNTRFTWPVLTSAGQLVWASGYPAAEDYAPRMGTRTGLVVIEQELQDLQDLAGVDGKPGRMI